MIFKLWCYFSICSNLSRTLGARGSFGLMRTLECRAPRPLPSVAGAKTKNFPYLSSFLRRGGVGGADKKWKGNFWFCFAVSDYKMNICIIAFVVLWRCSVFRPHGETRRFLSAFCGSLKLCDFDTGRGNSKYGLCWAQTNLIVLDPPSRSRTNPRRF